MVKTIAAKKVLMDIKQNFADKEFSFEELQDLFKDSFECDLKEVNFQNCHRNDFTFSELIDFFVARGKLLKDDNKLTVAQNFKCSCSHQS